MKIVFLFTFILDLIINLSLLTVAPSPSPLCELPYLFPSLLHGSGRLLSLALPPCPLCDLRLGLAGGRGGGSLRRPQSLSARGPDGGFHPLPLQRDLLCGREEV